MLALSNRFKGYLTGVLGILILSPDTVLLRGMNKVPENEVMFWRYLNATLMLAVFVFVQTWQSRRPTVSKVVQQDEDAAASLEEADIAAADSVTGPSPSAELLARSLVSHVGHKFTSLSRYGVLAGLIYGMANVAFLWAIKSTYAANVLVVMSTSSFFSSVFSYFLLGERLRLHTGVACIMCFGGILFIFAETLFLEGNDTSVFSAKSQTFGNLMALWVAVSSGCYFTLLRYTVKEKGADGASHIPINVITCSFVLFFSLFQKDNGCTRMGENGSFLKTGDLQILWLMLQGLIVIPVSFSLLSHASTMIRSAEVSMIMTLETVLGPLFVWLAGFDNPPRFTVYGGIIIIVALLGHEYINLKEDGVARAVALKQEQEQERLKGGFVELTALKAPEVDKDLAVAINAL